MQNLWAGISISATSKGVHRGYEVDNIIIAIDSIIMIKVIEIAKSVRKLEV